MENEIYEPREDSFLLEKYAKKLSRGVALDIGTGSGIQAKAALEKADFVIGADINKKVIDFCRKNNDSEKLIFIKSDLFSFFETSEQQIKFDTIIFNPPYLPDDKNKDIALDGGKYGYEVIERFLKEAKKFLKNDGLILLILSSFSKKEKIDSIIKENDFKKEELEKVHISFEDIYCYKITDFLS